MTEICPVCSLPKELCTCKVIAWEEQKVRIFLEKRKFGKKITIIEGISEDGKETISKLKQKLACGGTFKNGRIELQGDHRKRLKEILVGLGYQEELIEIS